MDKVIADLNTLVQGEVEDYVRGGWWKARAYAISDTTRQIYTVVVVPDQDYPQKLKAGIVVLARVVDDKVIIEHDISDKPLYDELMRVGVPREKIICFYAGEEIPETSK